MDKAYLVLEDGHIFEGKRFGAEADTLGELVFTTGMGGYVETITDHSYYGQIVMQTFPLIGNYGFIESDSEGEGSCIKGYVVRQWCEQPSNFRMEETLDSYLKRQGIPGIWGVDTREITQIIREHGVMNAMIVSEVTDEVKKVVGEYKIKDAVASVSHNKSEEYLPDGEILYNVALMDYGAKNNIERELVRHGCKVTLVPYATTADELLSGGFDGVMLSNGPGDPAENTQCIEEIKKMMGKIPLFGICLGHQLTALANGGKTIKLKYGHRGANQPVKQLADGRTYITSQNHGYAVVSESLKGIGEMSFVNANDATCEGIDYKDKYAFTVQFHPEACSGPMDTSFLFDRFIDLMEEFKNAVK